MKKTTWIYLARAALVLSVALVAVPLSGRGFGAMNYSKPVGINLKNQTYRDGVYTGTANAYRPGLTVAVTVQGGKVDAVSGATATSYGIMAAVEKALAGAK